MPDPQQQTTPTSVPAPDGGIDLSGLRVRTVGGIDLSGLRFRTTQQAKSELPQPTITPPWQEEPRLESAPTSKLGKAYADGKQLLQKYGQHFSEKVLAPFREGLDRIGDQLQQAGESGHTPAGGALTGPTRALVSGAGTLLKQVPIGRNIKETALMSLTPPEFPEAKALSRELKAGERAAAKLPPQPRLPDTGTHAAIKTDDGGIYPDLNPEKQRTHIMLAQDLGIPPERVVSGGWLKDGEYEGSERSDAGRWGEQARAKAAVAEKRSARSSESEQPPSVASSPQSIPYSESESARAYHGTSVDAIPSIRKSGITTDNKYGNVWAADTVPEAERYGLMGVQDYKWDADTQSKKYNPNAEYAVAVVRVKGSGLKETDGVWKGTEHVPPENIERFDIYNSDGKLVRHEPGVAKQTERTPAATETLYHGSPDVAKIDSLKPGNAGGYFGNGIYLTRDPDVARRFTKLESANPTLERNADGSFTDINTGKRVPGGKPGVLSVTLKGARLKSMSIEDMEAEVEKFRQPNGVINLDAARNAVADKYAKLGYDGFDVPASKNFDEPQVLIFPSSANKLSRNPAPFSLTPEGAQPLADKLGAKVVGSVTKKESQRTPNAYGSTKPRDLDLRIEGDYDSDHVISQMKEAGFEPSGSSILSPDEVKKSGQPYGAPGWKRAEHFENADGQKVDVWHDEPDSPKATKIDLSGRRVRPVTSASSGKNLLRFTASDGRIYQVPKSNKAAVMKADPGAKFDD